MERCSTCVLPRHFVSCSEKGVCSFCLDDLKVPLVRFQDTGVHRRIGVEEQEERGVRDRLVADVLGRIDCLDVLAEFRRLYVDEGGRS